MLPAYLLSSPFQMYLSRTKEPVTHTCIDIRRKGVLIFDSDSKRKAKHTHILLSVNTQQN
jgi:hypothetical protein